MRQLLIAGLVCAGCGQILGADQFQPAAGGAPPVAVASSSAASSSSSAGGSGPSCGDGTKNGAEACDGADLGGIGCASAVAPGWLGTVSCNKSCALDASACQPPASTYSEFATNASWALFDVSSVNPGAKGYFGATFDGRYLYLAPYNDNVFHGIVARYDTTAPFGMSGSWATFDLNSVSSNAKGYLGAHFDGRYVYFVPLANAAGAHGTVARYDTTADFGAAASWSTFNLATVMPNARGYAGSAFDGRYLYLAPYQVNSVPHGLVARLDTTKPFGAAAWTLFDVATVTPSAKGFHGAAFDGRFVYLVPLENGTVARYDTTLPFASAASWSTFDLVAGLNAKAFSGSAFDGHFLYLAPFGAPGGVVARYDTTLPFATAGSWSKFDITMVAAAAKGFNGALFDGRYVYLVPYFSGVASGVAARYDTLGTFAGTGAWSTFDIAGLAMTARGFIGGGFDGRYVYYVPFNNGGPIGLVARFDAKSPAWLPKGWKSSFF